MVPVAGTTRIASTVEQIVKRSRERGRPEPWAIGIRVAASGGELAPIEVGGKTYDVFAVASALEARQRLVEAEASGRSIVLLTALPEQALGEDVLARLDRQEVHSIRPWDLVRDAFRVKGIDPRLVQRGPWLADALLARAARGLDKVPLRSLMLDERTAWRVIFDEALGPNDDRPEPRALLEWTLRPGALERFQALPGEVRAGLCDWTAADTTSALSALVMKLASSGRGADAVPLGIACQVLFHERREAEAELRDAAVRLEMHTAGEPVRTETGREWAREARAVLESLARTETPERVMEIRQRADEILESLRADRWVGLGTMTPAALEARIRSFGAVLAEALRAGQSLPDHLPSLERASLEVVEHDLARDSGERVARLRMAVRLARWLALGEQPRVVSFEDRALAYVMEGGWVDRARAKFFGGDEDGDVARALTALAEAVAVRRERENEAFARSFVDWSAAARDAKRIVPVEDLLNRVVVPLAKVSPVLLLVIDGMSQAVFRELHEDLQRRGWIRLRPEGSAVMPPLISLVPSVTEFCRTSLFAGRSLGNAAEEQRAFQDHPGLVSASGASGPPKLFAKRDLLAPGGTDIGANLREALSSKKPRVVGAIINAVDDNLYKGDQLCLNWTVDTIAGLGPLLEAARQGERAIVLAADHGHVIDRGMSTAGPSEHDRYRPAANGPLGEGEILVRGPRVFADGDGVVALWSERKRYGQKRNGYHGGVSPAEVVAPLAVLVPKEKADQAGLGGWSEMPADDPAWWDSSFVDIEQEPAAEPFAATVTAGFAPEVFPPVREGRRSEARWIARLFESEKFAAQRVLVGRALRDEEQVRIFLESMEREGGTALYRALARRQGIPEFRVPGLISTMSRLLNVDGYAVVDHDPGSRTVHLRKDLLVKQFGLDEVA